ncbi:hypothetical protein A2U01_0100947, partial [Trifolium medium]|nr:hypothetical protein [Trifolium medium]
ISPVLAQRAPKTCNLKVPGWSEEASGNLLAQRAPARPASSCSPNEHPVLCYLKTC